MNRFLNRLLGLLMAAALLGGAWKPLPAAAAVGAPVGSSAAPAQTAPDSAAGPDSDWLAAVQQDVQRSEYHVTWAESTALAGLPAAYQAPNRAQNLRTYFTQDGPRLIPRQAAGGPALRNSGPAPEWELGLRLSAYGREGALQSAGAAVHSAAQGERFSYQYAGAAGNLRLEEWYLNRPQGLEQGFTLSDRPPGRGRLALEIRLDGSLNPRQVDAHAIEFASSGGVTVLRYDKLLAYDAAGKALPAEMRLAGGEGAQAILLLVDDAGAQYPLVIDPLASSPNWTAESDQASAEFGFSVSAAGDVNGDGYADVIVGARYYDNGQSNEGRAFVYHGSAAGLSAAAWSVESNRAGAYFGFSVSAAGDVNGDGYADVVVGAPFYTNGEAAEGRAFVYYGSASGLNAAGAWSAEGNQAMAWFGFSVSAAGDVNGDGYADVIVGTPSYDSGQTDEGRAYLYHGSASGLNAAAAWSAENNQAGARFGWSVATAGDVNGDGYADVIVGADQYDNGQTGEGRAYVYHGSASGLSAAAAWGVESNQAEARFGGSVSAAGDVNGDGYADVLIGAPGYDNGELNEGRAFVYHGSASGLGASAAWTAEGNQAEALFGDSVKTAGDVNGDGFADVIVGAQHADNGEADEGRASVYYGSASGLNAAAAWEVESNQAGATFGCSVSAAGDVNGDGYADVIVGSPGYDNVQTDEGRAYVYHGSAAGLSAAAVWNAESNQTSAWFGYSVSAAGDVNGDGYADVIIGVRNYDNGETDEGRAIVYHGSAAGLSAAAWSVEGNQTGAWFGFSVSAAGDVNGDGFADVIVGANRYDNGETDEGRAYLYHGSASGLSPAAAWSAESNQAYAAFGLSIGAAGDVNGDGYADVIVGAYHYDNGETDEGRAYGYHGSASSLNAVPEWTAESNQLFGYFGSSVSAAGDVNGDGYADVIVGADNYQNGEINEGRAFVYHGSASGLSAAPEWTAEGNQNGATFGCSVSAAGDVNGDGYADVIIGASAYDNGETNEGGAYVYHGSASGLSTAADWSAEGNQAYAVFGLSVSTAGDVNGDGYADVIVGANQYDNGQTNEGSAFLYYGNDGDGLDLRPQARRSDDSAPIPPVGLFSAGALRLAALGRTPFGRSQVKLEWELKPLGTPFDGSGLGQGAAWTDTGVGGAALNEPVSGINPGLYHWRVRLRYHPAASPFQQYSRWFTQPWNGWDESDLRWNCALPLYTTFQSGLWSNPATWNCGLTPPAGANVTIAAGHGVMLDSPRSVGSLTLFGSLSAISALSVAGDLNNYSDGFFSPSTVTFNGSGEQIIQGVTNFTDVTVGSGVTLFTISIVTLSGSLTNNGVTREMRSISGAGLQSFGLAGVSIDVTTQGGLTELVVERRDANHPNAGVPQQTGRWWQINPTGGGYSANLTLPYAGADAGDSACRYTGSAWDCAAGSYSANVSVTRSGVTEFSPWAVGNDAPTAVTLAGFQAAPGSQGVLLTWQTALELDTLGFNLYRSASQDGERLLLNPQLIPATALGALGGAEYQFEDATALPGQAHYYWLEVVNLEGVQYFGPQVVFSVHSVFLPIQSK